VLGWMSLWVVLTGGYGGDCGGREGGAYGPWLVIVDGSVGEDNVAGGIVGMGGVEGTVGVGGVGGTRGVEGPRCKYTGEAAYTIVLSAPACPCAAPFLPSVWSAGRAGRGVTIVPPGLCDADALRAQPAETCSSGVVVVLLRSNDRLSPSNVSFVV
jgi:hypothetical protein